MDATERLKIETPEQIVLELPLSGIGSRFLALMVDTLVQIAAFLLALLLLLLGTSRSFVTLTGVDFVRSLGPALFVLFSFSLYWGYFAFFEILWKGQTPGKRLAGIRVIKDSGRPIDATAAILRNLLRAIDVLPGMYGVGVIAMVLNRQSRRVGDFVAGTVVVHDRRTGERRMDWSPAPAARPSREAALITEEEVVLIETYLERRFSLDPRVGRAMALQIVARVTERSGLSPEPGQSIDEFLETAARQARDASRYS